MEQEKPMHRRGPACALALAACVVAYGLATLPVRPALAQPWVASRVGSGIACDQLESRLVNVHVQQRREGVPIERLLEKVESLPDADASKAASISRIHDVYLDPGLDAQTLRALRSAKCQRGLGTRDYQAFSAFAGSALMQCQAMATPGDRKFSKCIHALLDALEDKAQQQRKASVPVDPIPAEARP